MARCNGIIAYLEGDDATAKRELETVPSLLSGKRYRPFRDGNIAITKAYLCCVVARQGDTAFARKLLADARPYLVATDETALLAECERATAT